ncbi:MAG: sulfatase-like hydrolase/transferase, partial [Planctomycetes bacterium]|nr:sulfatase-like hydrolase/transferase [Planctomycetota bacterium]
MFRKMKFSLMLTVMCLLIVPLFAKARPNVVVILVDDLGMKDIACYGSTLHDTPNIDKLAQHSVRFTNGYSAHPVCSPTRAAIMTGKNPCRKEISITDWIPGVRPKNRKLTGPAIKQELPLKEITIAEELKNAGYATWFLGKWHLGETEKHWPKAQGFDVNIGGWAVGSPKGGYYAPFKNPCLPKVPEGTYLPDYLTSEAIKLVKERDEKKPFLLYLSFYTVHTPIQACKRHLAKYEQKVAKLPTLEKDVVQERYGISKIRQDNASYASM